MRDLDDLVNQVRDDASRSQLLEATRAYQATAFRSAIMSVWVSVALDLVSKLRQLADDGDNNARAKVDTLDHAIANGLVRDLQNFESTLLATCRDDFELIDSRDYLALNRLYEDQNVCAHPAFVSPSEVFTPTPELLRAHIRTAVDAVLQHPPTPGKQAIARFKAESQGTAWPTQSEDLTAYLRERYFARGKESMRRGLADLFVKGAVGMGAPSDQVVERLGASARALAEIDPALLASALTRVVRTREEGPGFSGAEMLRMVSQLGTLPALRAAFPEASIPRVVACIEAADWDDLVNSRAIGTVPSQPAVAAALAKRLAAAEPTRVAEAISVGAAPTTAMATQAVRALAEARGWRTAEDRMRFGVLPAAAAIGEPEMQQVFDALKDNDQVRLASGMPQLLEMLFDDTRDNPAMHAVWRDVAAHLKATARDGDLDDWYAYPDLVAKVDQLP